MTVDRRESPRVALMADVDFSSGSNFYSGTTRDISMGGLFIETSVPLEVGSLVNVKLGVMAKKFSVTAEVCWQLVADDGQVTGVGVTFVDLPEVAAQVIGQFMSMRDPVVFSDIADNDDF